MNVTIIGSGNLAWHLAPALDNTDYAIREIYSRDQRHAAALVEKLYHATANPSLDFSRSHSRIFIIAVADDAIEDIARELILPADAILVHTSGSQPLRALEYAATARVGVFYPLQTFTKNKKTDFRNVPFFIESEDSETEKILEDMARSLSRQVFRISSEKRKALHVAAVFASNFTNHMMALSKEILEDNGLAFEHMAPLIAETVNNALALGPERSQTGPARRGDLEILDAHVEFLSGDPAVAELYKVISQDILDRYHS